MSLRPVKALAHLGMRKAMRLKIKKNLLKLICLADFLCFNTRAQARLVVEPEGLLRNYPLSFRPVNDLAHLGDAKSIPVS